MQFFSSTSTQLCRRTVFRRQWVSLSHARCMSRITRGHSHAVSSSAAPSPVVAEADSLASAGHETGGRVTFEQLGLHPPIVSSLRQAFPDVKYPTEVQAKFIPAVLAGKDVLLKDATGSGKSFGLVVALLNKPRLVSRDQRSKDGKRKHITSLVLVPHRELAFQLLHWIERMVKTSGDNAPPLSLVAQVLVRDDKMHLGVGLTTLQQNTPHVLIGTPQALMDIYETNSDVLQLDTLSCVAVDEVDYLIETPGRKDPNKTFKKAAEKARRKLLAHPGPTRQLLDMIYARRKGVNERRRDEPGAEMMRRRSGEPSENDMPPSPQLVLCSATLRTHLRNYVYDESGWLDKDNVVKISGTGVKPADVEYSSDTTPGQVSNASTIEHSVLLVSEGRVRNIPGAVPAGSASVSSSGEAVTEGTAGEHSGETAYEVDEIDASLIQKYSKTPSPFSACMMETIAAAFAMDVPSIALLVLPSSSPVKRAVWELRELGVNAHGLDLQDSNKGRPYLASGGGGTSTNPTLLVSTLATTRGLDLPALSHVFVYGVPEGARVNSRTVDAYLHIAGRVGRFGRGGKVVTLVEESGIEIEDEEEGSATEEASAGAGAMARILKSIAVTPTRFAAFD